MRKGVGIGIPDSEGGKQINSLRHWLRAPWKRERFLSAQDAGGRKVHYTVVNKVDDAEEVGRVLEVLESGWKGDWGLAVGVGLWRYDRGKWEWREGFDLVSMSQEEAREG